MSRRALSCTIALPWLVACVGADGVGATAGRLSAQRDDRLLLEAPATGSRCAADTTIAVVALGAEWVVALSLRIPWPPDSALELRIVPPPAGAGFASVAARPVSDSVGLALIGVRGVVHLDPSTTLTGDFDASAPTQPGAPDSVRLTGRLTGIPIADDLCPGRSGP
jgi:hypothetical protein